MVGPLECRIRHRAAPKLPSEADFSIGRPSSPFPDAPDPSLAGYQSRYSAGHTDRSRTALPSYPRWRSTDAHCRGGPVHSNTAQRHQKFSRQCRRYHNSSRSSPIRSPAHTLPFPGIRFATSASIPREVIGNECDRNKPTFERLAAIGLTDLRVGQDSGAYAYVPPQHARQHPQPTHRK